MKHYLLAPLFFFYCLLSVSGCFWQDSKEAKNVILQVNQQKITINDFKRQLIDYSFNLEEGSLFSQEALKPIQKIIIRNLIELSLLRQEAKKNNIVVSEKELQQKLKVFSQDYQADQLKQLLKARGISFDLWQARLKDSILREKTIKAISKKALLPQDSEIVDFYNKHKDSFIEPEQVELNQILVKERQQAKRLWQILARNRKKFAEIASEHSIAPEANQGGSLGWVRRGILPPDTEKIIFRQGKGILSPVLKSNYGYHIYMVSDRREKRQIPLEEVKEKIFNQLYSARKEAIYRAWLKDKLRSAKILRNHKLLASLGEVIQQNGKL